MHSVSILLSSYNGEKYIRQQLDSILAQTGLELFIDIRDDGSKDDTERILKEYKECSHISISCSDNIGVTKSFWELVKHAKETDFYAFADQDDVWFSDKLYRASQMIGDTSEPTLYIGSVLLVDGSLKRMSKNFHRLKECDFFPERVIIPHEDKVLGCTMVWNQALQKIITEKNINAYYAHDQQLFFIAALCGKVLFDDEPMMLYRQHMNNTAAAVTTQGKLKKIKKQVRRGLRRLFSSRPEEANDIEMRNREFLLAMEDQIQDTIKDQLILSVEANHSLLRRAKLLNASCCRGLSWKKRIRIVLGKL